jgi:ribonuclease P protein component
MLSESTGRVKRFFASPGILPEDTLCARRQADEVQRRFRLTSSFEIKRVRRLGKSYAHPLLVLIAQRNELATSRFAVSAGRSVGNAVQRNRAKRLLREAIRPLLSDIEPGWDVLLLARQPMEKATFQQSQEALVRLLERSKLLVNGNDY